MVEPMKQLFSDEEYQLANVNELGSPLVVYEIKFIYRAFLYACSVVFFILCLVGPTLLFIKMSIGWQKAQGDDLFFLYALLIILEIGGVFGGLFILRVELPKVQKQRLIVCEQGLLQLKYKRRMRYVEVLYWRDVVIIKRFYDSYHIIKHGNTIFTLDILYQRVGEIISLIKTRIGKG